LRWHLQFCGARRNLNKILQHFIGAFGQSGQSNLDGLIQPLDDPVVVGADRKLSHFAGSAEVKASQVFNLLCCLFKQRGSRSDHHGHDWQDPTAASEGLRRRRQLPGRTERP
jgi:hypothetical protein